MEKGPVEVLIGIVTTSVLVVVVELTMTSTCRHPEKKIAGVIKVAAVEGND